MRVPANVGGDCLQFADASDVFLQALEGIVEPEQKPRIIGRRSYWCSQTKPSAWGSAHSSRPFDSMVPWVTVE